MKVHPVIHFFGKATIRLVLVLVFVGIPAAAYYLRTEGIGFGAREELGRVLSSEAIDVRIGRLALDPFSGLLARDITLRERTGGGRLLARVSDVAVSLNFSELVAGRVVLDKLSLNKAEVSVPLEEGDDATRVDIRDVRAEVILLGDTLRISRFDGMVENILVRITGQFVNPKALHLPDPQPGKPRGEHRKMVARALEELAKLRFPSGPPIVRADLEADLANLKTFRVENFLIQSGPLEGSGWSLRDLELRGEFGDGLLAIPRLAARDGSGSLEASVEWSQKDGTVDVAMLSTLQPGPFLKAIAGKTLRDLTFGAVPEIELRAVVDLKSGKPTAVVSGAMEAPSVSFRGVDLRDVGLTFMWKDGIFHARDVKAGANRGRLDANVWVAPDDYRLSLKTSIPPTAFAGLLDPNARKFIEQMEFKDLPEISVSLRGKKLDFENIRGNGKLKLGRTAMRKSWLDSATADFEIADRCFTYRNFLILRDGGRATGTFAYDIGRREARLNNIHSTMIPYDVLMWIDPKIALAVKPYKFRAPPSAVVQGMVHLSDAQKNNLNISLESASGLDYDLLGRTLRFGKTSAKVDIRGAQVHANVQRAALMDGLASLKAIVSIDDKDPRFSVDVKLDRVNFADLTKLYFDYSDSKGVMSGAYQFDARAGEENLMRGKGNIRVEDGNVFAIPILGPFSDILNPILPGAGYHTARLATADFTVADEKIHTRNCVIEGAGFSMLGDGDIYFMTSRLDMNMRLSIRGIPGLVFYPVSKLLEYASTGTVRDPEWRPKIIPRFHPGPQNTPKPKKAVKPET